MGRILFTLAVATCVASCGLADELDRRSLRSADDCRAWPGVDLTESGYLRLMNGLGDDALRTVRIESAYEGSLACAVDLTCCDAHQVRMPPGIYYLRVTWCCEEDESERHWFHIRDGQVSLVVAYPEGYAPNALYDARF
ncbi:MAG: hypothetical protein QNJ98_07865 [Planctomycetota bacterium]|nr:hypothetical protein [Planctomycetota bacterium]